MDTGAAAHTVGRAAAINVALLLLATTAAAAWTESKIAQNEAAVAARYPVAAVDFLQAEGLAQQRGYNSYKWGGYLIWRGVPVFVDGRADVYGDDFLNFYLEAFEARSGWREPLDAFDVRYVLMERGSPLLTLLAASGEWRQAYGDGVAQVFVRRDGT